MDHLAHESVEQLAALILVIGGGLFIVRSQLARRRTIELSLARAKADLESARSDAHRDMLTQAIATLEGQLKAL